MTCDQLLARYRTVRSASEALGYTVQAINGWRRAGKIPQRTQQSIEYITRGKLKADRK